uniref:Uncharacterized protein n=1 Tax=Triticum urartu TaxID=4572 RepID=A0A8R7PLN9_TRIUA
MFTEELPPPPPPPFPFHSSRSSSLPRPLAPPAAGPSTPSPPGSAAEEAVLLWVARRRAPFPNPSSITCPTSRSLRRLLHRAPLSASPRRRHLHPRALGDGATHCRPLDRAARARRRLSIRPETEMETSQRSRSRRSMRRSPVPLPPASAACARFGALPSLLLLHRREGRGLLLAPLLQVLSLSLSLSLSLTIAMELQETNELGSDVAGHLFGLQEDAPLSLCN